MLLALSIIFRSIQFSDVWCVCILFTDSNQSGAPYPATSTDSTPGSSNTVTGLENTSHEGENTSDFSPQASQASTKGMEQLINSDAASFLLWSLFLSIYAY